MFPECGNAYDNTLFIAPLFLEHTPVMVAGVLKTLNILYNSLSTYRITLHFDIMGG